MMSDYFQNIERQLTPQLINSIGEYVDAYMDQHTNRTIRPEEVSIQFNISGPESFNYLAYFCDEGKLTLEKRFKNEAWGGVWCNVETPMGASEEEIANSDIRYIFIGKKKNKI